METAQEFIKRKNEQFLKDAEKTIPMKDIGRQGKHNFIREAWTFMQQSNMEEKVFILERLRKVVPTGELAYSNVGLGEIEYRIGYFIIGRIGRARGKWIWGQFCPLIPQEDLMVLIEKAKQEKVII